MLHAQYLIVEPLVMMMRKQNYAGSQIKSGCCRKCCSKFTLIDDLFAVFM